MSKNEIPDVSEILGPGGVIASALPGYEFREGQIDMAVAVEKALTKGHHLDVEAPCGVGKTLAYLVPAILKCVAAEKQVVVCTANIALQEQLMGKDLPLLAKVLPVKFSYALAKGMGNYLCLTKLHHVHGSLAEVSEEAEKEVKAVETWAGKTPRGDRSEITLKSDLWPSVCGNSDECDGWRCDDYKECFVMKARRAIKEAHVIVCNYHLFFANAAIRMNSEVEDPILPGFDFVIADEAHEMADIARDFFGFTLRRGSVKFLKQAESHLGDGAVMPAIVNANAELFGAAEAILRGARGKHPRLPEGIDGLSLAGALDDYRAKATRALDATPEEDKKKRGTLERCINAATRLRGMVEGFTRADDPNMTYFVEGDPVVLKSKLIDVGPVLGEELFKRACAVVSTSATLTDVGGSFAYFERERGNIKGERLVAATPFNFEKQCLLVTPNLGVESPNDPAFVPAMGDVIARIVGGLDGRTMCLFTSYKSLKACADIAEEESDIQILRQGDEPRTKLLEKFRSAGHGVALFGTDSFWQGVDIPGQALSCLVIDKIPFEPPDDPVLQAMGERDPNLFMNVSLPRATIKLRQGFGRLIRAITDVGAVVIFDPRLFVKPYGKRVLSSLPACRLTDNVEEIFSFVPKVEVEKA